MTPWTLNIVWSVHVAIFKVTVSSPYGAIRCAPQCVCDKGLGGSFLILNKTLPPSLQLNSRGLRYRSQQQRAAARSGA